MFLYISLPSYCSQSLLLCALLFYFCHVTLHFPCSHFTCFFFNFCYSHSSSFSQFPLSLCSHPVLVISGPSHSPFLSTFLVSSPNSQPTFFILSPICLLFSFSPLLCLPSLMPRFCLCIAPSTVPPEAAARERPAPEQRGAPAARGGHQQTIQAPPAATTHGHAAHCRYARKHTLTHPPSIVMTLHDHYRAPSPPPSPLPPNSISRLCSPHRSSGSVL